MSNSGPGTSDTNKENSKGPIKPLPDPPRNKADRDKIRVFALVVGINKYQGKVPPLGGCVNDAHLVANYLRKKYGTNNDEDITITALDEDRENDELTVEKHFKGENDTLSLQLCVLLDEQATYDNIIRAFEEHLVNNPDATGHDSFWFHFSGHGTEQFTAREFYKPQGSGGALVPNGKDQSLVCYNGGNATNIFLADKEIGLMLEKVHQNVRIKGENQKPHVLVTLDCCHSGGGTRDFLENPDMKTRNAKIFRSSTWEEALQEKNGVRKLDSYYKGAFGDESNPKPRIPYSQHLLISACDNTEKAGDTPQGGVFTTNLINVLKSQADGEINYVELFTQARARAKEQRKKQTIQLEAIEGFNPYTAFLEGWALGTQQKYEIKSNTVKRRGKERVFWSVQCGAINGLPTNKREADSQETTGGKIQLQIYSNQTKECLGNAFVTTVGMQDSGIELEEGLQLKSPESQEGDNKETYHARIFSLPVAHEYIYLDGSENSDSIKALLDQWENESDGNLKNFNIFPLESLDRPEIPGTIIKAHANGVYTVSDAITGLEWFTQPVVESQITILKSNLFKLIRWRRFIDLDNPKSKLLKEFDAELVVADYTAWTEAGEPDINKERDKYKDAMPHVYKGEEIKVYGSEKETFFITERYDGDIENYYLPHFIRFRYKTPGKHRYFYVFGMQSDGTILFFNVGDSNELESTKEGQIIDYIGAKIKNFKLEPHEMEGDFVFKIFVTTEPIDPEPLTQNPFKDTRAGEFGDTEPGSSVADKWCCLTMKVKVAFQSNEISAEKGEPTIIDSDGLVSVEVPQDSPVKAKASLVSAYNDSRSLDPASRLAQFEDIGLSMLSFGGNRDVKNNNIIELTDISPDTPTSVMEEVTLENGEVIQQPKTLLKVNLDTSSVSTEEGEDAAIIPIAFDGQHFKVIGDLTPISTAETTINIRELPKLQISGGDVVEHPFGDTPGDRSLFKALKMAFFKVALKKKDQNKLCWVRITDGKIEQHEQGIIARIEKAKRILLVIHGIIGDTTPIVEPLVNLLKDTPYSDTDSLILTYDYENLNTPISGTAANPGTADKLKKALEDVGLGANHGKDLTILAHSMGGLVSRSFIEQKGGDKVVNHLIMAGTPNSGSPFGKIEGARSFAVRALELSANFFPNLIPFSGYIIKGLQGAASVFKTLGEMNPNSEFLSGLNNSDDPSVKYSILAGDSTHYDPPGEGFSKFMENLELRIGDIANIGRAHDIAVPVDSIENKHIFEIREPKPVYQDAPLVCHHLNYFTNDHSRQRLKALLNGGKQ